MAHKAGITRIFVVKLFPSPEQRLELLEFLKEWRAGLNFALRRIEEEYQRIAKSHEKISEKGCCDRCGCKDRALQWRNKVTGEKLCSSCYNAMISEYGMKKYLISTKDRPLPREKDVKQNCSVIHGAHYDNLVAQAYAIWKSFHGWRRRQETRLKSLKERIYRKNPNLAKVHSVWFYKIKKPILETCTMCGHGGWYRWVNLDKTEVLCDNCFGTFKESRRELKKVRQLLIAPKFPVVHSLVARIDKSFFSFLADGHVKIKLLRKEKHVIPHSLWVKGRGKNKQRSMQKLRTYISKILKEGQKKRVTLFMKNGDFYISYPLTWRKKPVIIDDFHDISRAYVTILPWGACVTLMDNSGQLQAVKFFHGLRKVMNRRQHIQRKRAQLMRKYHMLRNKYYDDDLWVRRFIELCQQAGQRKAKQTLRNELRLIVLKMHDILSHPLMAKERKISWYSTHYTTREVVNFIKQHGFLCAILPDMEGMGNLSLPPEMNRSLRLWSPTTLQKTLLHKLAMEGIPVKLVRYKEIKRIICPKCKTESNKATLSQILAREKTFTCELCGYSINYHLAIAFQLGKVLENS